MSKKIDLQASKEFQLKVQPPVVRRGGKRDPATLDRLLFERVCDALTHCAEALSEEGGETHLAFPAEPWQRRGVRFDTAPKSIDGLFRQHGVSLAIEATDARTKLKCKHHALVPELIFDKPKRALSYPHPGEAADYKRCNAQLKLEQDLHFNNTKSCVSGSLFLKGRHEDVATLAFFSQYFPRLEDIAPASTQLYPVVHWNETVFDNLTVGWEGRRLASVMLVNRWDDRGQLVESELAYKVAKGLDQDWDHDWLRLAARFYLQLQASGVFQADPPIFYVQDPVASVDIVRA